MYSKSRVYILGVGNIGKFFAYALRKQHPGLPISLLFHRPSLIGDWDASGRTIECVTDAVSDKRTGFDVEIVSSTDPIDNLIVATKTTVTACALGSVKHRLRKSSNILFLQNGIGTTDEVSALVFRDANSRPSYWVGVCSCSIYRVSPFSIVHAGRGAIELGPVSSASHAPTCGIPTSSARPDFITQLLEVPDIEAVLIGLDQTKAAQLRKLTVNAVLNPLTAIFRCSRGELLDHPQRFSFMEALFQEVADIVRALTSGVPQSSEDQLFEKQNLWSLVLRVAESSRESTSSMLHDIEAGQKTEIDYINGYIASQAQQRGLTCFRNNVVVTMVKRRQCITDNEIETVLKTHDPISASTLFKIEVQSA
ncbi:hypothetical protein COCCADRAFT_41970 [Bipolaris zeicola 26-R-13]|uniref:2-dehydropantoate 2-reductase n=1 Tax=Cochliobolus carbonum (strain 26-R-13) TaxID=930089 RepID=W6XWY3_COCC2|nr:uncharacterized protein COCCADRAFT_41970 [Bipolaris zeicola 26-R-13]EUC27239.1 hypothetical protein COCCADRAFT_41970 [Bipolaris zeicola 26-R-13]